MEKLFYQDTHLLDFEAIVTECLPDEKGKGYLVVLDRTAFFPEEGGQLADTGTINDLPVLDVRIQNDVIYHLMESPMAVGEKVTGHVDWERRLDFMQQHTGEHILSGLVHKYYGFDNVGFHLGLAEVTMDFDGSIGLDALREIEKEANAIVWKNLPVYTTFPEKEILAEMDYRSKKELSGDIRIVEIPGVDICACCAPHVDHTGEIGLIKIISVMSHRGGVRVNILCGKRALEDYTCKQQSNSAISVLLSAKPDRTAEAVKKVQEDALELRNYANELENQLLQVQVEALPSPEEAEHAVLFTTIANTVATRNVVNALIERYSGYCGVFAGTDESGYNFIIGSANQDCRQVVAQLREKFGAKGGGTAPMVQGSVKAARSELETLLHQVGLE